MKNLYLEIKPILENYISLNKISRFQNKFDDLNLFLNAFEANFDDNISFNYQLNNFTEVTLIRTKSSGFLQQIFNIDNSKWNELISILNFINNLKNSRINKKTTALYVKILNFKNYLSVTYCRKTVSAPIEFRFFNDYMTLNNHKFFYLEEESFPVEKIIYTLKNDLKELFINFGIEDNNLMSKNLISFLNKGMPEFVRSKTVLKNFVYKDSNEIKSSMNFNIFSNEYSFIEDANTHFLNGVKVGDFNIILKSFSDILNTENYNYFYQTIELIRNYIKLVANSESCFPFLFINEANRDYTPEYIYKVMFILKNNFISDNIIYNNFNIYIGKNITKSDSCSLVSYTSTGNENLVDYNNMKDLYMTVLEQIMENMSAITNKEFSDISLRDLEHIKKLKISE